MDWKEFFKPTIAKIIIFIILLVVGLWINWLPINFLYQINDWLGRIVFFIESYLVAAILVALYKTIKK